MKKTCLVCGGSLGKSKIKGLVQCDTCGFLTTNLELTSDEIKRLYSANYYHGEEYADYLSDKEIIQHNFRKRIKRIGRVLSEMKQKRLFEIGCAYGFFLETAKKFFCDAEGIDISEDAVQYAKENLRQNAHAGDFATFENGKKYDVICMWDTIEHLERPQVYVKKAHDMLEKDGYICITTGDVGSLNARMRGRKWRQIHPPTHLHYFSRKTLTMLLDKSGFRVVDVSYPANTISVNTILYTLLCIKSHHEKLYQFFKNLGITKINLNINFRDFMFIIAQVKQ
ncbi:MAG: class I SAM-dependent methyltransferase [Lachnospiraceae bacterium]|nr:class I SAM-dependent methyltransferase [Lachnospiraceae bacterium]